MTRPLLSLPARRCPHNPLSRLVRRCVWVVRTSLLSGCIRVPEASRRAPADASRRPPRNPTSDRAGLEVSRPTSSSASTLNARQQHSQRRPTADQHPPSTGIPITAAHPMTFAIHAACSVPHVPFGDTLVAHAIGADDPSGSARWRRSGRPKHSSSTRRRSFGRLRRSGAVMRRARDSPDVDLVAGGRVEHDVGKHRSGPAAGQSSQPGPQAKAVLTIAIGGSSTGPSGV